MRIAYGVRPSLRPFASSHNSRKPEAVARMWMGNNVLLLVSSVQRVERVSHKTQSFHLINFIKRTKPNKDKAIG